MNYVLPKGWQWVRLGEIAHVIRGVTFDRNDATDSASEDTYPILRAGNISDDLITDRDLVWVPSGRVSSEQLMQVGDVAICMSSGSADVVGKTAQLRSSWSGSVGAFCALIRAASPVVDTDYFGHVFTSPVFTFWRKRQSMGANIQNLRLSDVESVMIPVPPLSEQRRIVEILNEARDIRLLRQQADDLTTQLIPAIFNEMFGDPLSNNRNWPVASLPKLGTLDRGRSRHRPRDEPALYGGPYPFIQTGDIANAQGWITDFSQTYSEEGLAQSRLWPAGTMCITIAANIGATAILSFDACFPDSVVGFTPNEDVMVEYVKWTFDVLRARNEARAHAGAQKNINLKFLNALQIGLPPKDLQIEFRRRLQSIREIHRLHSEETEKGLRNLTSSLLAYAFSGELTADWRTQNRELLTQEAAERDQWLRENGVKLTTTDRRGQSTTDPTDGLAWELNRDQRALLAQIQKIDRNDNGGLFTLSTLKLDAPLDKLPPDTVRRHLDVLTARGLVLAVSRRAEHGESVTFGNVYRLPLSDEDIVGTAQQPDHARLSELGRLSRLGRVFFDSISDRISLTDSLDGAIEASEGDE